MQHNLIISLCHTPQGIHSLINSYSNTQARFQDICEMNGLAEIDWSSLVNFWDFSSVYSLFHSHEWFWTEEIFEIVARGHACKQLKQQGILKLDESTGMTIPISFCDTILLMETQLRPPHTGLDFWRKLSRSIKTYNLGTKYSWHLTESVANMRSKVVLYTSVFKDVLIL